MEGLELLLEKLDNNSRRDYDIPKIKMAYEIARKAHEGQYRHSGEPYITHPMAVAHILADYNMHSDVICAAILHDTVEDTDIKLELIEKKFGKVIKMLVDGVTNIGIVPLNTKEEHKAENTRKILIAMSKDVRVMLIKLADRLHNMRTLEFKKPHKQRDTCLETMTFYAHIAHRLGLNDFKEELEDLAIRCLDPHAVKAIEEYLSTLSEKNEAFISTIKSQIAEKVSYITPPPEIEGRVKGIYSIYKKVYKNGKNIEEIYDIYAVRVIVETVSDCYGVMGLLHDMFTPMEGRIKDYIASPKPNNYRSLHSTVIAKGGIKFEFQIRTREMHNTALYGVAAHWKYKAGISNTSSEKDKRLEWIRQLLETDREADDIAQINESLRVDLSPDIVSVFTPNGDVIALPVGSTVIDFAYSIHTQVGHKMLGAKVGGKMASLDYKLKMGDLVEILTTNASTHGPNLSWLEHAHTTEAKTKIRAWHKRENRGANIERGRDVLDIEFKKNHIPWDDDFIKELAVRQRFDNADDFYASIGYGGVSVQKIMQRIKHDYENAHKPHPETNTNAEELVAMNIHKKQLGGVSVQGLDNCDVKYAQCCNPLPGDDIIGFVTKGHGISVHKTDCPNVHNNMTKNHAPERWVSVTWNRAESHYRVSIDIVALDRTSLIADITGHISENKISITDINAHFLRNGNANIIVTVEVCGVEQLSGLIAKIRKIKGVISVERTTNS